MSKEKKNRESITLVIDKRVAWVGAILVIGFVAWSLVRLGMSLGTTPRHAHASCQFELEPGDHYLLARRVCPGPDCKNELLDCHGESAHRIKGIVKEMLVAGKHPDEIRASLDALAPRVDPELMVPPEEAGTETTEDDVGSEVEVEAGADAEIPREMES